MTRSFAAFATCGLLLTTLVVAAPAAVAEEYVCHGTVGAATLDNVTVPTGATCTLDATTLEGTLKVERGATAVVSGADIDGNIQPQGHRSVTVTDTRVGGSIQLEQGGAAYLRDNRVNGDVQLFTNRTGTKSVYTNTIGGNLQCKDDVPAPVGGGNVVDGNAEDQCRDLTRPVAPGDVPDPAPAPIGTGSLGS